MNPNCRETGIVESEVEGGRKAITRDLDGNILEAVYLPPGMGGMSPVGGGEGMAVAAEKESRRVLMWQKEVAKSTVSGSSAGSAPEEERKQVRRADTLPAGLGAGVGLAMRLVRRETVTEHYTTTAPSESPSSPGGGAFGGNGKAIIGTILGAAAGAAVAYAMTRSEAPSAPIPVYPHSASMAGGKPTLGRSATYSHPEPIQMQEQDYGVVYGSAPSYPHVPIIEVQRSASGRSHASIREPRHVRYAIQPAPTPPPASEDRMIESKSRIGESRVGEGRVEGSRVSVRESRAEGSRVSVRSKASQRSRSEYPPDAGARSRVSVRDDGGDGASNVSSRSKSKSGSKSQSGRARSHVSRRDVIEVEVEEDRRSSVSHSSKREKHSRRDREERDGGRDDVSESFTSARSHASSSTAKPLNRHKSTSGGSRVSVTIVGRDSHDREREREHIVNVGERERERTPRSHVSSRHAPQSAVSARSARDIPLPASVAGTGRFGGGGASYVGRGVRGRDGGDSDEDGEGGYGGLTRARMAAVAGGDGGDGGWDEGSVAPSDSVSSVGIKRERERLRGRMGY